MRIMAVDYGDARTGLAVCDAAELLASPAGVLHIAGGEAVAAAVCEKARELGAELIVVGNPLNMNGTEGPRSELCAAVAELIRQGSGLPVTLWDERGTTVTATRYLNMTDTRGKKRKNTIDAVAAVIILESFLAYRANHPQN